MMKNFKYFILIVLSILTLYGCPTFDPQSELIEVHNNTDEVIFIYYSCNDSISPSPKLVLYDTLKKGDVIWKIAPPYRVPAYTTKPVIAQMKRADLFKRCSDNLLNIFFIKEETMLKNTWEEIYQNQLYAKVESFTYDELEKMDWVIFYSSDDN